ncbi:MAG: Ig-like domain-containing protein [Nocardioides sp.]
MHRRVRAPMRHLLVLLALVVAATPLAVIAAPAGATPVPTCATAGYTVAGLGGPNFYLTGSGAQSAYTGYRVTNATGSGSADLYVTLGGFTGGSVGLASGQSAAERLGDLSAGDGESLFWYLTASAASASAQNHTVTVYRHDPALPTAVALCTTTGGFATVQDTISANANKVTSISLVGGAPHLGSTFTITVTGSTGTIGQGVPGDSQSFWMTPSASDAWPANAFRLLSTSIRMSPDGTAPAQTWTDRLRLAGLGSPDRDYTATYTFRAVGFTSSGTSIQPVQQIASGTQIKHTGGYPASLPAISPPVNDLAMAVSASPSALPTGGGTAAYDATVTGTAGAELDALEVTLPADASIVPGSLTWAGQPVGDPVLVSGTWHASGPFVVPSGGGTLHLSVQHGSSTGTRTSTVRGVVGPSFIGTSVGVVDGSNAATASVQVNRPPVALSPSVVADAAGTATVAATTLATDPDGDPLVVTGVSGNPAASVVAGHLAYAGSPPSEGDPVTYTVADGRGGSATGVLTVYPAGTAPQAEPQLLEVSAPGGVLVDGTATVLASATSGLDPAFSVDTPATCTVDAGGVVTGTAAGTCTVRVTQPGDATWEAATPVSVDLAVARRPQHLAEALGDPTQVGVGATATLDVTSDEALPVSWAVTTPGTCSVVGGIVSGAAAGTCRVVASQSGTTAVAPATDLEVVLDVVAPPAAQQLAVDPSVPTAVAVDATTTLPVSATSGLDPAYASASPATCTVDAAGTVTGVTGGVCRIVVSQPGDAAYAPAADVEVDLDVVLLPQTVAASLPGTLQTGDSVPLVAAATSALPVSWSALTPATCTVDAQGQVRAVAPGACRVRVEQPGDSRYAAATPVEATSTVVAPVVPTPPAPPAPPVSQRLSLVAPDLVLAGPGNVPVAAASTSGLPVSLAVVDGPCGVEGGAVTVPAVGTCVLEATQAGTVGVTAAAPVRATLRVVLPQDDVLDVPAGWPATAGVLDNDPAGLALTAVAPAAHGTTALAGGAATYRPARGYRGADAFTYTVTDPTGRTARARVDVTVRNAPPTVAAPDLAQLAGTTRSVTASVADPNDDALVVSARASRDDVAVEVRGTRVVLTPAPTASGRVRVTVRVEDGAGGVDTATLVDTVSPLPVPDASRYLTADGTRISWRSAAAVGAAYDVLVDGRVVCRSTTLACSTTRVLGPLLDVSVRVRGLDGTTSTLRPTSTAGDHRVLMATVYFDPSEDRLTAAQHRALERVADRVLRMGFADADLEGYTDSDGDAAYNLALSHRRTRTIAALLGDRAISTTQAWFGMDDPAASNASAAGKAANRRVEIYVGF